MFVEVVPTVKQRIINPSVLVQEDSLVILLYLVGNLQEKICVHPILVDLEPAANLEMTDLDQTGLSVLALLVSEETLWYIVPEESVRMIVNVLQVRHVSTFNAKILAKMLVELELNVNQSAMVLSVLVLMGMSVIH